MRFLGRSIKTAILASGILLTLLFAALFLFGRPHKTCPGSGVASGGAWLSRYIPLYSKQCPGYYRCPMSPGTGRQVRPDGSSVEVTINGECFRGNLPDPTNSSLTLVVLGDSFSFGWGVRDEEAYPAVVGMGLGRHLSCPLGVVNLAVPGYSLHDKLMSLKEKGLSYGPDVVVLQTFWDDWYDTEESQSYIPPLKWAGTIMRRFGCDWCGSRAVQLDHLSLRLFLLTHSGHSRLAQKRMGEIWEEFAALSEQEGFVLVVLDLGSKPVLDAIPRDIAPSLERHLIPYFGEWEEPENLIPGDGHQNPAGHGILAAVVVDEIINSGEVKC